MFFLKRKYQEYKRKQVKKVFIFSALSAFISAVAALLLTPKSGKENRDFIVKKTKEVSEKTKDLASKATAKIAETKDQVTEKVNETSTKIAVDAKKTGLGLIDRIRNTVNNTEIPKKNEESIAPSKGANK